MNTISTTLEFNGTVIKVENGHVFARAFGTTIYNHSPHWSWLEVEKDNLKHNLKRELKERGLI